MAKAKKKGSAGRSRRKTSGSIRVRAAVSERRALIDSPGSREVRERIDAAISQGQQLRQGILDRMNRASDLPVSAIGGTAPRRKSR